MKRFLMTSVAASALIAGPAFAQQWDHPPDRPAGYSDYYHDADGSPDVAARYGYRAGFDDGVADKGKGHSFRPTEDDNYKKVPDIHNAGMTRKQAKDRYREAYVHGYEHGYGRHS